MPALVWSRCAQCGQAIAEGSWQALARVPGTGRRCVHEHCAHQLGVPARPVAAHDRPGRRGAGDDAAASLSSRAGEPLRVLVLGSIAWPRERAVEVRDRISGIAALAELTAGSRRVLLVHGGRVRPKTGRLAGVDAWTELTAIRLGLDVVTLGAHPGRHDRATSQARHQALIDAGADLVLAFPLTRDPATGAALTDPATTDAIARAEAAELPVVVHPDTGPHPDRQLSGERPTP